MFERNKPTPPSTPQPATPPQPASRQASYQQPATAPSANRSGAVLSSGVSIKGELSFRNELLIDGAVEGTITSAGSGTLTIGEHAKIKADITAGSVIIHGKVDGNITASERCSLEAGATLRGDIEAPRLSMDDDSSFSGRAKITRKG